MKNLSYLFILLIAFSCKKESDVKPKNFIEKNKMIDLIIDMKIADKAKTVLNKDKKKNQNYMAYIYEKYKIDSTQFKSSSDYYTDHLELYKEIYSTVQKRLKDSVNKYDKLIKLKDSIAREEKKKKKKNIKKELINKAPVNKISKRPFKKKKMSTQIKKH